MGYCCQEGREDIAVGRAGTNERKGIQEVDQGGMVIPSSSYMDTTAKEAASHQGHDGQEREGQEFVKQERKVSQSRTQIGTL